MGVIALDTLKFSKKLITAGVPQQQAEAYAEALADIAQEQLATKHDLQQLETRLENKIDTKINLLRHELTMRLGGLIITSVGIAIAVLGFLISMHH